MTNILLKEKTKTKNTCFYLCISNICPIGKKVVGVYKMFVEMGLWS